MPSNQSFTDRFLSFLSECVDDHEQKQYLLAISGGIDSIVMLQLFHSTGLSVEVAHCNFDLRDDASDADEQFVKEVANVLNIVCYTKTFATNSVAKEKGISTQMAARELRYDWFEELMTQGDYHLLCTAHHRGDHAETVVFNLTKGTGIAGLHGIRPLKDCLLRPLMPFTRQEIAAYARKEGLKWREDASNQSNKYSRNLIRNEVMPLLKQINPSVEKSLWQSSQRIGQVENWLADELSSWEKKLVKREVDVVFINTSELYDHLHRDLILSELIRPYGFSYAEVAEIIDQKKVRSGRQFITQEYELVWDRDQIVITPRQDEQLDSITIDASGEFTFRGEVYKVEIIDKADWQLQRTNDILQADADKIQWPLILRTWREGDAIQPLGMKGRKKVSDILIDEKVPLNLKSRQLVLEDHEEIVWLVGLRMGDKIKLNGASQSVVVISKVS